MPLSEFESKLKSFYEAHKRSHLNNKLETATAVMQETLLLSALHEGLFEDSNEPSADIKDQVQSLRSLVAANEFDEVEDEIDTVLEELESELEDVRSTFRTERHELVERVAGFKSLNQRIERLDPERIDRLLQDLQTAEDTIEALEGDFEEQLSTAEQTGAEIAAEVTDVEDDLFKPFRGSDIEDVVRDLLRGEALTLSDYDVETFTALQESELGAYVNLALEGED